MTRHQRNRLGLTYLDMIVLLICVGLGLMIGCWGGGRSHETASRVRCASNLRQIGQALLLYANDNGGKYPRVVYLGGPDPKPVFGTGAAGKNPFVDCEPNDVTGALFLLLRAQDITSEVFACPSSNVEKDTFGGGTNAPIDRANFTDLKKNLSYSLHNPYVRDGVIPADDKTYWTHSMSAEFAVAADINPGVAGGDNVLGPTTTSSATDMKKANADNHDRDGQNILYGDGHVAWESNPFVGIDRENIYSSRDGRVAASPVDMNDSVLLPTDD